MSDTAVTMPDDVLISVRGLRKYFPIQAGWLKKHVGDIKAIEDVALDIKKGETFGRVQAMSFGLIWLGLALFTFDGLRSRRGASGGDRNQARQSSASTAQRS